MTKLTQEEHDFLSTRGSSFLQQAGFDASSFERLSGGRNNRVYLVRADEGSVILKWYFRNPNDDRERLHFEYSFCEYAKLCGARCTALPLARNDEDSLAVYSQLDGKRLTTNDVTESSVTQAIEFLLLLNSQRDSPAARQLPSASEACFSLRQHVHCIAQRVTRLMRATQQGISPVGARAKRFIREEVCPATNRVNDELLQWAAAAGVDFDATLPDESRVISPSDFGFHNALLADDHRLAFVDFEYAGWDDPAKTVCDFYCQPEVPAPQESWQQFAESVTELVEYRDRELELKRFEALMPLYQIKWACILLNEFTNSSVVRRKFASQQNVNLEQQLDKASAMLHRPPIETR